MPEASLDDVYATALEDSWSVSKIRKWSASRLPFLESIIHQQASDQLGLSAVQVASMEKAQAVFDQDVCHGCACLALAVGRVRRWKIAFCVVACIVFVDSLQFSALGSHVLHVGGRLRGATWANCDHIRQVARPQPTFAFRAHVAWGSCCLVMATMGRGIQPLPVWPLNRAPSSANASARHRYDISLGILLHMAARW